MFPVYYRALVNFTNSLVYSPELEDIFSAAFNEISEAVVDTVRFFFPLQANLNQTVVLHCTSRSFTGLRDVIYVVLWLKRLNMKLRLYFSGPPLSLPLQLESDYHRIPGSQTVNVVLIK